MKLRVRAPSRLHFGLLGSGRVRSEAQRTFGGAGLMIEQPGVEVRVGFSDRPGIAAAPSVAMRERGEGILQRLVESMGDQARSLAVDILQAPDAHVGLGTGTQLAVSIAVGGARLLDRPLGNAQDAARITGRGRRSAIGVHGFFHGGFLVDGGRSPRSVVAPLAARHDFPSQWRIVLIEPEVEAGLSGEPEQKAFDQDVSFPDAVVDRLCRLLLLGVLPSLVEEDFAAFGPALDEYNRLVGECFAAAQGGIYAHPRIAEIVQSLRALDVVGVGQSSWGPTIYAMAPDVERAEWIAGRCQAGFAGLRRVQVVSAFNSPVCCLEEK